MWYSGEKVLPGERLIGAALRLMGDADGVVDQKEADNRSGESDGRHSGSRQLGERPTSVELTVRARADCCDRREEEVMRTGLVVMTEVDVVVKQKI
jgi:hypothetical protein